MLIEILLSALAFDGGVALGLGKLAFHLLAGELEPVEVFDGLLGGFGVVEDDEGLALAPQALLGDDVDNGAIFGKDLAERLGQVRDFELLFEVFDLDDDVSGHSFAVL